MRDTKGELIKRLILYIESDNVRGTCKGRLHIIYLKLTSH